MIELLESEDKVQDSMLIPKTVSYQRVAKEMLDKVGQKHPQLVEWEQEAVAGLCTIAKEPIAIKIGDTKSSIFT